MQFLDLIRGGSAANQGEPEAGNLPSDGAQPSQIRSIFSILSTAEDVLGSVNSFREGDSPNQQRVVGATPTGPNRFLPWIVVAIGAAAVWWFFLRKK